MRQLTCTAPHEIEWRDVPEPRLASDTDALVRPLAVARCDIDLILTSGLVPLRGPFALGHEAVVEVVDIGDSVPALTKGQRAVVSFELCCGRCPSCRAGHTANCDRYPVLSDYGMQPLSGVEYGGMLSDLVRVPHAATIIQIATLLLTLALGSLPLHAQAARLTELERRRLRTPILDRHEVQDRFGTRCADRGSAKPPRARRPDVKPV